MCWVGGEWGGRGVVRRVLGGGFVVWEEGVVLCVCVGYVIV